MAYNRIEVASMIRHVGSIRKLAPYVGQSESSMAAQHTAAITFFQIALKLTRPNNLSVSDADFARTEIVRHHQAMQRTLDEVWVS
jgi:hypothetical protein